MIELRRIGWTNDNAPAISEQSLKAMEDNIEEAVNESKAKVLWNGTKFDSFEPQTVSLNTNDYDYLIIKCYRNKTIDDRVININLFKNNQGEIFYLDFYNFEPRLWSRRVDSEEGTVKFGEAVINRELNNNVLIPFEIIGVKF